jgi:type IV secretion system protein VirB5
MIKEVVMSTPIFRGIILVVLVSAMAAPASAQWAVVDAPAIIQLIQEVKEMEQEVQTAESQLSQAKQALATMTGDRGMELLLSGVTRNYLPSSWTQLTSAMTGNGLGATSLSSSVFAAVGQNAVLTPAQLATLSPADQRQIAAARQSNALQQALAQSALSNSSARFASIQSLISAISTASDQKGILDLQARISAELGMLQNEQTKLQVLHQATEAQTAIRGQQERELVIAGQGNFATRFQPTP